MPNTTYEYMAIRNMKNKTTDVLRGANRYGVLEDSVAIRNRKNKTTDILRGQIDLESWKTLTKNVRTTRYKMYDLKNEEINLDFNTS